MHGASCLWENEPTNNKETNGLSNYPPASNTVEIGICNIVLKSWNCKAISWVNYCNESNFPNQPAVWLTLSLCGYWGRVTHVCQRRPDGNKPIPEPMLTIACSPRLNQCWPVVNLGHYQHKFASKCIFFFQRNDTESVGCKICQCVNSFAVLFYLLIPRLIHGSLIDCNLSHGEAYMELCQ